MVRFVAFLCACLVWLGVTECAGQLTSDTWRAPVSGSWGLSGNWTDGTVPGPNDAAVIGQAGEYIISFATAPATIRSLSIQNGVIVALQSSGTVKTLNLAGVGLQHDFDILGSGTTVFLGGFGANPINVTLAENDDMFLSGGALPATLIIRSGSRLIAPRGLQIGKTGDGTLLVDGVGTVLKGGLGLTSNFPTGEYTARATFQNGAVGDGGAIALTRLVGGGKAYLSVLSGASLVNIGSIEGAFDGSFVHEAIVTVDGNSSINQSPAATIDLGSVPSTSIARIDIGTTTNGAAFTTGTLTGDPNFYQMFLNHTATVNIGTSTVTGTLNANGDIKISGGLLRRNAAGTFNFASGRKMLLLNGGRAQFYGSYTTPTNTLFNVTDGSKLESVDSALAINNGATVNVSSGGQLAAATNLDIASTGNGTLTVDGLGSAAVSVGEANWGRSGFTANVAFRNNGSGTFGNGLDMVANAISGTKANVTIETGADVTVSSRLTLVEGGAANAAAVLSVQGIGSTFTQNGTSPFIIGNASTGTAALSIGTTASGAAFTTSTGLATIFRTGTLTVGNGANTGAITFRGNLTIDGGILRRNNSGSTVMLPAGATVAVQGGGRATFAGGYTTSQNAVYNISGSNSILETTDGALNINNGAALNVFSAATVSAASPLHIGTQGNGTLTADGTGTTIAGGTSASFWGDAGNSATITLGASAVANFPAGLELARSATASTTATVGILSAARLNVGDLKLAAAGGATTTATLSVQGNGSAIVQSGAATTTIGSASNGTALFNLGTSADGASFTTGTGAFRINKTGTLNIGAPAVGSNTFTGTLNLNGDANIDGGKLQIAAGSAVQVAATKSIVLTNGGTLAGAGTVNGNVTNTSGVVIPGPINGGFRLQRNYTQGSAGKLAIDLAGTTAGTLYDRLTVVENATFNGSLEVALQNSFSPALGNSFDILDWNTRSGTFSSIALPKLSTGLAWNLFSFYTTGTLSVVSNQLVPGDFNRNGQADSGDITSMLKALTALNSFRTSNGLSTAELNTIGDLNGSGTVTNRDIQLLLNLVAQLPAGGVVVPVPEPSSWVTIASGIVVLSIVILHSLKEGRKCPKAGRKA